MDIVQTEWSQIFGRFIFWGITLFMIFSIIRYGIPYLFRNKKKVSQFLKYFRLIELTIWVFYLSWFLFLFAEAKSFFALLLFGLQLGIIYLLLRFWLADLIAGIIFRNTNKIDIGDSIQYEEHSGKIIKIGGKNIEIENTEGSSVYIPYRKITSAIFSRTESTEQTSGYSFELETSVEEDIDDVIENIRSTIVVLPWSSIRKAPQVLLKNQTDKNLIFNITVFATDRSYFGKIESHAKKKFA